MRSTLYFHIAKVRTKHARTRTGINDEFTSITVFYRFPPLTDGSQAHDGNTTRLRIGERNGGMARSFCRGSARRPMRFFAALRSALKDEEGPLGMTEGLYNRGERQE